MVYQGINLQLVFNYLDVAERLGVEMASLIYYVLGLSIMSGVIVSISSVIEEKTKKLDVTDPMDAIRNLRIENLNSKAMKKLGYKVDEGMMLPPTLREGRMMRRGTIIPDTDQPKRRVGRLANDHLNLPNGNSSQERIENGGTHLRPPSDVQNSVKVSHVVSLLTRKFSFELKVLIQS